MNKILTSFGFKKQPKIITRADKERMAFERHAKEQFVQLKKKGLGIRIIVL